MKAILELDKMPDSCIDCPCEYDSIFCVALEEDYDFIEWLQNGVDYYERRLPNCPLKEVKE